MNLAFILALAASLLAAVLALAMLAHNHRAPAHWYFALGMAGLAVERLCVGMSATALRPEAAVIWQGWAKVALAVATVAWVGFSLAYTREKTAVQSSKF